MHQPTVQYVPCWRPVLGAPDCAPCLSAEQEAKSQRVDRLVLLTTRTADWFEQRGFQHAGPAHASPFLPDGRRQQVCVPVGHDSVCTIVSFMYNTELTWTGKGKCYTLFRDTACLTRRSARL